MMDAESVFWQVRAGDMNLTEFEDWVRVNHTESFDEGYNEAITESQGG